MVNRLRRPVFRNGTAREVETALPAHTHATARRLNCKVNRKFPQRRAGPSLEGLPPDPPDREGTVSDPSRLTIQPTRPPEVP